MLFWSALPYPRIFKLFDYFFNLPFLSSIFNLDDTAATDWLN